MSVEERRQMLERKYDTDEDSEAQRNEHALPANPASAAAAAESQPRTAPGQFPAWVQQALREKQQRDLAAKERERRKRAELERHRRASLTANDMAEERALHRDGEHQRYAARTDEKIVQDREQRRQRARQKGAVRTKEEIEQTRKKRRENAAKRKTLEEKDAPEKQEERRRKNRERKRAARARGRTLQLTRSPQFASDEELRNMQSTGRFGICSPAVKSEVFNRTCHSLGSHGMGKKVCAVCDALTFQTDVEEQLVTDSWLQRAHMKLRADEELESNPSLHDYYNAAVVHGPAARCLKDLALSPKGVRIENNTEPRQFDSAGAAAAAPPSSAASSSPPKIFVSVCNNCRPAMRTLDTTAPVLAIANGFYVGEMPPDLRDLPPIYWRLVSLTQATPLTQVCRGGGNHQLRAHVHIWGMPEASDHPIPPVVLPRMLDDEAEYFKVVLAGPFTPAQELLLRKRYTVHKSVLFKLFNWLCENNYIYREKAASGEFEKTNFDRMPDTAELQFHRVHGEKVAERLREPESVHSRSRDTENATSSAEETHFQQTTSAMASTVIEPSERFEIPLFAHRRSTALIRDQDAAMLPYVFLRQLPYGYPKPEQLKTLKGVSYQRLVIHLMKLSSGCFTDAIAILMAFNSYARAKAMKATRFQLRQSLATQIDSLEEADMVRYTNYLKQAQQSAGIGQTVSEVPAASAFESNIQSRAELAGVAAVDHGAASSTSASAHASSSSCAKALWQQVRIRLGKMPLTNEERQLSRNKAWSMVNYFGNPHLFITLSVNELGSLTICSWTAFSDKSINVSTDLSKLNLNFNDRPWQQAPNAAAFAAGSNADMELQDAHEKSAASSSSAGSPRLSLPSRQEIAKTVYERPFEAADYFIRIVDIFFHDVCGWDMRARRPLKDGGLFGHVKAFFGNPETAGRGGLHLHLLLWLHGMPRTEKEFAERELLQGWHASLIQWLDSFNRATLPIFQPAAASSEVDFMHTDQSDSSPRCTECKAGPPLEEIKLPQSAGKRAARGVPEPAVAQCPRCEKKYSASDIIDARIGEIKAELGLQNSDAYSQEAVRQRMALPLPPAECRPLVAPNAAQRHVILHHQLLTSLFLRECNVHDYRHFDSCFKKSKTAPVNSCRFRMPRKINQGPTAIDGDEVMLQRRLGSNWLNPYVDVMIDLFRFNHDCRALIGSYASQMVYYVVKYISKDQKAVDQQAALDLGLQAFRNRRERDAAQMQEEAAPAASSGSAFDSSSVAARPIPAAAGPAGAARLINAMTYQLSNMQETSAPLAAYYLLRDTLEYTSHELPKLLLAQAEAIVCGRNFESLLVRELERDGGPRRSARQKRQRTRLGAAAAAAAGGDSDMDVEPRLSRREKRSDHDGCDGCESDNVDQQSDSADAACSLTESGSDAAEPAGSGDSGSEAEVDDRRADVSDSRDKEEPPPTYHSITQLYDYMNRSPSLSGLSLYSYIANFRKVPIGRRKRRVSDRGSSGNYVYSFTDAHVQHLTHVDRRRFVPAVPLLLGAGSRLPDVAKLDEQSEDSKAETAREAYGRKALILFRPFQRIEELKSQPGEPAIQRDNEPTWWEAWTAWRAQIGVPAVLEAEQHLSFMQEYWNGKHVSNERASELQESWLAQFASDAADELAESDTVELESKREHDSDQDIGADDGQYDELLDADEKDSAEDNALGSARSDSAAAYFPGQYDGNEAKHAAKAIHMRVQELDPDRVHEYDSRSEGLQAQAASPAAAHAGSGPVDPSAMEIEGERAAAASDSESDSNSPRLGRLADLRLDTKKVAELMSSRDYILLQQRGTWSAASSESDRHVLSRISAIQGIWPNLPAQWQDITRLQWPRHLESDLDLAAGHGSGAESNAHESEDHDQPQASSSAGCDGARPEAAELMTSQRAEDIRNGILCYPSLYEVAEAMSLKEEQQAAFIPPAQRLIDYFQSRYTLDLQQIRARSRSAARRELPASFGSAQPDAAYEREQLLQYIGGVGGAGKSHVVKALVLLATCWNFPRAVRTIGPTGVSAVAIRGTTIHRALAIHVDQKQPNAIDSLGPEAKEAIKEDWNGTVMVVIDEISMVAAPLFAQLSNHLGAIFSKPNVPFGGIHVIVAGDFLQIPPVRAIALSKELDAYSETNSSNGILARQGRVLWESFKNVYFVNATPNPRFTDPKWGALCDRARLGELTHEDIDYVNQRLVKSREELWDSGRTPITLYHAHVDRFALNLAHLVDRARHHTMYRIRANFDGRGAARRAAVRAYLPHLYRARDDELDKRLAILDIYIGMRVMVTANVAPHFGVANGTIGTVYDIQWKTDPPTEFINEPVTLTAPDSRVERASQMPDVIYIQLSDPAPAYQETARRLGLPLDIFPIVSSKQSVTLKKTVKIRRGPLQPPKSQSSITCQMEQFPLVYTFAQTVHKVQGCTLDCVIAGQWVRGTAAYVMLSRVRKQADFACLEELTIHKASSIRPHQEQLKEHLRLVSLDQARRDSRIDHGSQAQSAAAIRMQEEQQQQPSGTVADEF